MKIGFLQQHNTADTKQNLLRLAEGISDLAKRGAELIVLQELHNSLYFCQVEDVNNFNLAEPIPGPSTAFFGELAKQFGVVIVTSLFERRAPGLYHNTAVVLEKDGNIAGIYRKTPTAVISANTAKCTSPMTPATTRSSISLQVT